MGILSKEALLGASDLVEREVPLPTLGEDASVRVKSLPAAASNDAISMALEMKQGPRGDQTSTINTAKLEVIQVFHGLVEPKLASLHEAEQLSKKLGPAWREIVRVIDEISGVDKDAWEKANAQFPDGGSEEAGANVDNGTTGGSS